jgi:hypothetical protein
VARKALSLGDSELAKAPVLVAWLKMAVAVAAPSTKPE